MKIRSITDVITNSSSEVFTLRTDKTPSEVYQWLKENIHWQRSDPPSYEPFTEPEVMAKGEGNINWLVDFGYLWDSGDKDDIEDYKVKHCLNWATRSYDDSEFCFGIKKHGLTVKHHWEKFCSENMEELLKFFSDNFTEDMFWDRYQNENDNYSTYLYPSDDWTSDYDEFIKKFIKYYEEKCPNYIPNWWSIPEYLDVQYWKGKVGFSTTDENSIQWQDIDKICEEFNGKHWHMG